MAQNVSNRYREIVYSDEKVYKCNLSINSNPISPTDIQQIKIERPIIDINNQSFYIGTFISDKLEIKFKNTLPNPINSGDIVTLSISLNVDGSDESVNCGTFIIDELGENYYKNNTITCFDNSIKFEPAVNTPISQIFTYDQSTETYSITLENLLIWLCSHYNVTLGTYPNVNKDKIVGTWDSTLSGKQYISWIAELMGGNAKINRNGELCIYSLNREPIYSVDGKRFKTFELGEKFSLNTIKFDDGIRPYTATNGQSGNTLYIRNNNMFVSNQQDIDNIFNSIGGLVIYSIKFETFGDLSLDAYDIITVEMGENEYNTFYSNNITYAISVMANVSTQIPTKQQELTTNVIRADEILSRRRIYSEFDQQNARITLASEKVDGQDEKIAKITNDYETIMAELSNITDITVSGESENAYVDLNGVNESEPVELRIRPLNKNISYLYPSIGLYPANNSYPAKQGLVPSNTLTPSNSLVPSAGYPAQGIKYPSIRTIRFTNKSYYLLTDDTKYTSYRDYYSYDSQTTQYTLLVKGTDYQVGDTITGDIYQNKEVDYELPYDLLYYDSENYDEFYLNYDSETCQVIKKCKYNTDGTVGLLSSPITYNIDPYPTISLLFGNYRISILGYDTGYIFVRLMAANIYTTQFYTKVETNRRIQLSAEGIISEVSDSYTLKSETETLASKIAQKAAKISLEVTDNSTSAGMVIRLRDENNNVLDTQTANITLSGLVEFSNLTDGVTTISGSNITTGSINATLIKTGTLDASQITVTNLSANSITSGTITASAINLGNNAFSVTTAGVLTASSGTIGGWTITDKKMYAGDSSTRVAVVQKPTSDTTWVFAAGGTEHSNYGNCPFRVSKYGQLYASSGLIGGWTINTNNLSCSSGGYTYRIFAGGLEYTTGSTTRGVSWEDIVNVVQRYRNFV